MADAALAVSSAPLKHGRVNMLDDVWSREFATDARCVRAGPGDLHGTGDRCVRDACTLCGFRQSDHTRNAVVARALAWKRIILIIFKKRFAIALPFSPR